MLDPNVKTETTQPPTGETGQLTLLPSLPPWTELPEPENTPNPNIVKILDVLNIIFSVVLFGGCCAGSAISYHSLSALGTTMPKYVSLYFRRTSAKAFPVMMMASAVLAGFAAAVFFIFMIFFIHQFTSRLRLGVYKNPWEFDTVPGTVMGTRIGVPNPTVTTLPSGLATITPGGVSLPSTYYPTTATGGQAPISPRGAPVATAGAFAPPAWLPPPPGTALPDGTALPTETTDTYMEPTDATNVSHKEK